MRSVDALMSGLIDYAGLFPPAGEDMRPALENYASYLKGPDRRALGRFIVPLPRLRELEEAGGDLMPRGTGVGPWHLSVLISEDARAAGEEIVRFNERHAAGSKDGHILIDVAELKATTPDQVQHQQRDVPATLTAYFEIPLAGDVTPLVHSIGRSGARAKMRTGGVTPEAFPPAEQIIDFITACAREKVPFKATAGLHHPIRAERPLTYEQGSVRGVMYGFVNVFLAAALVYAGESHETALAALEEGDPTAITFEDQAIVWKDHRLTADQMAAARAKFAIAFGSCSFREPVDELAQLTRHARAMTK